tara:strand:- start:77 stop:208 length:132 start_codon:yes stop_codon:yes gene_type:complete
MLKKRIKPDLYYLTWFDIKGKEVRLAGTPKQIISHILTMEEIE